MRKSLEKIISSVSIFFFFFFERNTLFLNGSLRWFRSLVIFFFSLEINRNISQGASTLPVSFPHVGAQLGCCLFAPPLLAPLLAASAAVRYPPMCALYAYDACALTPQERAARRAACTMSSRPAFARSSTASTLPRHPFNSLCRTASLVGQSRSGSCLIQCL